MAKGYLPLFFDSFEETQDLTDEEFGRLIRAIGLYAMGDDSYADRITGNEKYAFRFLKGQVDRNAEISVVRARARIGKTYQNTTNNNKPEQTITNDNKPEEIPEKENKKVKRFVPPTVEEVRCYCIARNNGVDPEQFVAFYASKGWRVGQTPMKDWKQAVITWEKRNKQGTGTNPQKTVTAQQYTQRDYDETPHMTAQMLEELKQCI